MSTDHTTSCRFGIGDTLFSIGHTDTVGVRGASFGNTPFISIAGLARSAVRISHTIDTSAHVAESDDGIHTVGGNLASQRNTFSTLASEISWTVRVHGTLNAGSLNSGNLR